MSNRIYALRYYNRCIGAIVVFSEPAVWVLTEQIEDVSEGTIKKNVLLFTLAIGVAIAIGLSLARVIFGFSIWYLILPGYALALILQGSGTTSRVRIDLSGA